MGVKFLPISPSSGTVTVTATDLDIRNLVFATDKVDASGSTVTANAGTNLNTSLLALEAGGNLATIAGKDFATSAKQDTGNTSLSSIDGKITAVNTGAVVVSSSALPTLASTSTKQSDGSQKTQVVDGSGNVISATSNALDINVKQGGTAVSASAPLFTKQQRSATPTQSSVNDTASSTTLLAANAARLGATIFNDSTVNLYLKLGATASTTSFTILLTPNDYYEVPYNYTGIIDGIWASDASGAARITELVV